MPIFKPMCSAAMRSMLLLLVCSNAPAWAQLQDVPASRSMLAIGESEVREIAAAGQEAPAPTGRQPSTQRPPQVVTVPRPRLTGSTTGYVENAFIGSQVRVRFDAGFGIATPDRAEFFYAKCGCYRLAGVDPDAQGPVGVLPPGANPAVTPLIENDLDYRDYQFYGEFAPNQRISFFVDAPVRSLSPTIIPEATGFGDLRAGAKLGLIASDTQALTFQFRSYFASGDSEKGLGTAHPSVELTLLYSDVVADRVSIGGEFGSWIPIDGASAVPVDPNKDFSGSVLRWGFGVGVDLVGKPAFGFAPVVEVVGWHVLGGYASVTPDGTPARLTIPSSEGFDIVNLKLGGRFTFSGRHSLYAGYGFPMTDAHWYDEVVRVEYRFAF